VGCVQALRPAGRLDDVSFLQRELLRALDDKRTVRPCVVALLRDGSACADARSLHPQLEKRCLEAELALAAAVQAAAAAAAAAKPKKLSRV
jgi:hypothetical protein